MVSFSMTTAEIGGMHYYCCYRIDFDASSFSTHASRLRGLRSMKLLQVAIKTAVSTCGTFKGEDIPRGMNKASTIHLCTSKA